VIPAEITSKDDDSHGHHRYLPPMTSTPSPTSMKKTVLTFGLISGAVTSVMMVATVPFIHTISFEKGAIIGYTSIVLSSLIVFFGVRSYRDNVADGHVSFGRAFGVGLLIALISCACYVVTWEILYFEVMPDFGEKFTAHMVERVRASGATPEKIAQTERDAAMFKQMYDNPIYNAALTFTEPFPISLAVTLISAAVLRRK
jgi:hypothetical protein